MLRAGTESKLIILKLRHRENCHTPAPHATPRHHVYLSAQQKMTHFMTYKINLILILLVADSILLCLSHLQRNYKLYNASGTTNLDRKR